MTICVCSFHTLQTFRVRGNALNCCPSSSIRINLQTKRGSVLAKWTESIQIAGFLSTQTSRDRTTLKNESHYAFSSMHLSCYPGILCACYFLAYCTHGLFNTINVSIDGRFISMYHDVFVEFPLGNLFEILLFEKLTYFHIRRECVA